MHLRFELKAAALFRDNQTQKGLELVRSGAQRISKALEKKDPFAIALQQKARAIVREDEVGKKHSA